jgi:protein-S-isoprenylcysteine O-methyltransferase Ste14
LHPGGDGPLVFGDEVNLKEKNGEHPFGDTGQLIALLVFLVVWLGDSFAWHASTFLSAYVPIYMRLAVLVITSVLAFTLSRSGHFMFGGEQRPSKVVVSGAFKYVRHPLYLASLLTYLGLAFCTMSLIALTLFVLIWIFHDYIASYEEKLLETKYGDDYKNYKRHTGKWIPMIGKNSGQ